MVKQIFIGVLIVTMFSVVPCLSFAAEPSTDLSYFQEAGINWRAAEGETIHFAGIKAAYTVSTLPLIEEFEKLTGIRVLFDIVPSYEYWTKLQVDLSSRGGFFDIFMTGPYLEWTYIKAGWVEPLDPYLNDPELTNLEWYDTSDFIPAVWQAHHWDGKSFGPGATGTGNLWAIPITIESYILAYRKDLFEKYGVAEVPTTWPELKEAAKKCTQEDHIGYVARGARSWDTLLGGHCLGFFSSGAHDFDENLYPVMNSPQGIEWTEFYADLIRKYGPEGFVDYTWYQMTQNFMSGKSAMIIDCDLFATSYEDPKVCQVAGKVGYALPPKSKGALKNDIWTWGLSINAKSYHKTAAWLFLQWATSKRVLTNATVEGINLNPSRWSTWNDPRTIEITGKWGDYRKVVEENWKHCGIRFSVNPEMTAACNLWAATLQEIVLGKKTAKQGLDDVARQIERLMEKAGYYD